MFKATVIIVSSFMQIYNIIDWVIVLQTLTWEQFWMGWSFVSTDKKIQTLVRNVVRYMENMRNGWFM